MPLQISLIGTIMLFVRFQDKISILIALMIEVFFFTYPPLPRFTTGGLGNHCGLSGSMDLTENDGDIAPIRRNISHFSWYVSFPSLNRQRQRQRYTTILAGRVGGRGRRGVDRRAEAEWNGIFSRIPPPSCSFVQSGKNLVLAASINHISNVNGIFSPEESSSLEFS